MSRSVGLAHVVRQENGTTTGVWGVHTLHSAFQPIFEFYEGKLILAGFEGLVRPFREGEAVSPATFFNSIPRQDRAEVETLTRTLHLLNAGAFLDPNTDLFVNFDPSLFVVGEDTHQILRDMRLTLHEAGIDAARVVCEVTEQPSTSHDLLLELVASLRGHDFRIAIDDYGADESDIHRIQELSPDIVKFDGEWTARLLGSTAGVALLKTMVGTFKDWGITTLFEGIEESEQLDLAEECAVDLVQGFVLARPQIVPGQFGHFSARSPGERQDWQDEFAPRPAHAERDDAHHAAGRQNGLQARGYRSPGRQRVFGRRGAGNDG